MKDKEKQIEEMKNNARIYIGAVVEKLRMDGCELYEIDGIIENILNYITVPEGSVVLSREEYEELKFTKTVLELREEKIKYLEDANIRYAEALELKVNKKERKETAEKIIDYVYKVTTNIVLRDKLAKQFEVEVE